MRSPDGTVEVTYAEELVGHHTVREPVVTRVRDGRPVLDLRGTSLDPRGDVTFAGPGLVRLLLRSYPVGSVVAYDLTVDVEAETFGLGSSGPHRPLAELPDAVRELRSVLPDVRAADLAAGRCPRCGGRVRRAGTSAFDTTKPFECAECGGLW